MIETYLAKGWSLFPLKGKIPKTKDGFKSASNDPEKIKKMFNGGGSNVGIATGDMSGVFVLDIDVKKNAGGDKSLDDLIKKHGELPRTATVKTWSGGLHYYFHQPEKNPIGCKAGIRPGIDIRGNGGYVVAPPSSIEGKPYEWITGMDKIAKAPGWLIDIINEKTFKADLTDDDLKITENRNDTLASLGAGMRKLGFKAEMIHQHLSYINETRCVSPLGAKEVKKIADSVSRYEPHEEISEPLTDVFNARYFTRLYGDDIRYCAALGGWFIWDYKKWLRDTSFEIIRMAQKALAKMREEGWSSDNKELVKHAIKSETKAKIDALISLARANDVAVESDQFDSDNYIVNCQNGILDLNTGKMRPHNKSDYCTKIAAVNYSATAECPRWEQFLKEVFNNNTELIRYIQKAVGYSLSGSIEEQCLFILYGIGRNGKSTFLKHIHHILGDYSLSTPSSTLMERYNGSIPNDVARLKGSRFVSTNETGQGKSLAEPTVKQLTGDDPITARFLHKEYFDFFATFKIFMATNHKPDIKGTDKGIWSRLITIPFSVVIPPEKQDHDLDNKLRKEYEGIFRWAVEGYRLWREEGLELVPCIEEMRDEYRADSDIIGQFIEECCQTGPGNTVPSSKLIAAATSWGKDNGCQKSMKNTTLTSSLKDRGFEKSRSTHGPYRGLICWYGIALKKEESYEDNWDSDDEEYMPVL